MQQHMRVSDSVLVKCGDALGVILQDFMLFINFVCLTIAFVLYFDLRLFEWTVFHYKHIFYYFLPTIQVFKSGNLESAVVGTSKPLRNRSLTARKDNVFHQSTNGIHPVSCHAAPVTFSPCASIGLSFATKPPATCPFWFDSSQIIVNLTSLNSISTFSLIHWHQP